MRNVRFQPPPVERSPELAWVLAAAYGPHLPPLAPERAVAALALARRLDLVGRIRARHRTALAGRPGLAKLAGEIERDYWRAAAAAVVYEQVARDLAGVAAEIGVPVLFLKGFALELLAKGADRGRFFCDLDVLAPPAGARRLQAELVARGYATGKGGGNEQHLPSLVSPRRGAIDLHHRLRGVALADGRWATFGELERGGLLQPAPGFPEGSFLPSRGLLVIHLLIHAMDHHMWRGARAHHLLRFLADSIELVPDEADWQSIVGEHRTTLATIPAAEISAVRELATALARGAAPDLSGEDDGEPALLLRHALAAILDADYERSLRLEHFRSRLADAVRQGQLASYLRRLLAPDAGGDEPTGAGGGLAGRLRRLLAHGSRTTAAVVSRARLRRFAGSPRRGRRRTVE